MFTREAYAVFLFIALATGVPVVFLLSLAFVWDAHACTRTAEIMGTESYYSVSTDCMIKVDNRWEPLDWQRSVRIKEGK